MVRVEVVECTILYWSFFVRFEFVAVCGRQQKEMVTVMTSSYENTGTILQHLTYLLTPTHQKS